MQGLEFIGNPLQRQNYMTEYFYFKPIQSPQNYSYIYLSQIYVAYFFPFYMYIVFRDHLRNCETFLFVIRGKPLTVLYVHVHTRFILEVNPAVSYHKIPFMLGTNPLCCTSLSTIFQSYHLWPDPFVYIYIWQ